MRRIGVVLLGAVLFFYAAWAIADEDKKNSIPVGMEKIKVGGSEFVVPRGVIIKKRGDLIVIESANEYVARKIYEMEKRLDAMEAKAEEDRAEIRRISQALVRLQKVRRPGESKK